MKVSKLSFKKKKKKLKFFIKNITLLTILKNRKRHQADLLSNFYILINDILFVVMNPLELIYDLHRRKSKNSTLVEVERNSKCNG